MTFNIFLSLIMAEGVTHEVTKKHEASSDRKNANEVSTGLKREQKKLSVILQSTQNNIPCICLVKTSKSYNGSALLSAYERESATIRISSEHVSSIEELQQYLRMGITLKIKETKHVYEGEITEMSFSHELKITLKSLKGSKTLKFSPSLFKSIQNENISIGDIIYVECNSGIVKRLGRSESCMQDNYLESDKYLSIPKGDLLTKREVIQTCTLHELDFANTNPNSGNLGSLLNSLKIQQKVISQNLRDDIDSVVRKLIESKKCEISLSTILIDNCSSLDSSMIAFLNYYATSKLCPSVFLICRSDDWINKNAIYVKNFIRLSIGEAEDTNESIIMQKVEEYQIDLDANSIEYLINISNERGVNFVIHLLMLLTEESGKVSLDRITQITELLKLT